mmetsp:Transcript_80897/g.187853  ORF Transcript_80897/g.187853 Transcript_80897/m.187853 type:complete len:421 (+) Transcript_80897:134-1396(+)
MKRAVLACASVGLSSLAQLDETAQGQAGSAAAEVKSQEQQEDYSYCGKMEDNVDYWASNLYHVYNVSSAQACCSQCQRDPDCRAWTWGKARHVYGLSNVCYLKGLAPGQVARRKTNENTTSGLPFRADEPGRASLFCFTSILAEDVDPQLLALEHMYKAGIFSCEEYDVYSRRPVQLVPGVRCTTIEPDADCSMVEHASSCANFGFVEVWQKVVSDGRFRYHNWTVKVDPDAVFFPGRLLKIVRKIPEPETGVYLSNCDAGLMEPLEVLSRKAVQAYALGYMRCVEGKEKLSTGEFTFGEGWSEGMFMDQCLLKVLKVERKSEMLLLSDPNCQSEDVTCKTEHVSFHPVDRVEAYHECLSAAQWPGLLRVDASSTDTTQVVSETRGTGGSSVANSSQSFGKTVRMNSIAALPPAQPDQWT